MGKSRYWFLMAILTVLYVVPAWTGNLTDHGFIYQPGLGARGNEEKNAFEAGLSRVDLRLGKEIWVGDPNYGSTLQTALSAIGSGNVILRVPAGTHTIAADLTIPANITIRMERGAVLSVPTAKTLTIQGGMEAGIYQIFSCTGTGQVVFGAQSVQKVYPEWWAVNTNPGTTDMLAAITAALNSKTGAVEVMLQATTYAVSNSVTLDSYHQLLGVGMDKTYIKWTGASGGTVVKANNATEPYVQMCQIKNLSVSGNGIADIGINLTNCSQSICEKVIVKTVKPTTGTGWLLNSSAGTNDFDQPCIYNTLRNCEFYNAAGSEAAYGFRIIDSANSNTLYSCLSSGGNIGFAIDSGVNAVASVSTNNAFYSCSAEPAPITSFYLNGESNSVYSPRMENASTVGIGVAFGTHTSARTNTVINPLMYRIATQYSGIDIAKGNLIIDPNRIGWDRSQLVIDKNLVLNPSTGDAKIKLVPNNGGGGGSVYFGSSNIGSYINGDDNYLNFKAGSTGSYATIARIGNTSTGPFEVMKDFVLATKTPASANATGITGQIAWDTNYIYVCVGTNTWKRAALTSW